MGWVPRPTRLRGAQPLSSDLGVVTAEPWDRASLQWVGMNTGHGVKG